MPPPTAKRGLSDTEEEEFSDEALNPNVMESTDAPPAKKRKTEKDAPRLDPNAIDHSLDLAPPPGPHLFDTFALFDEVPLETIVPPAETQDNEIAVQPPVEEEAVKTTKTKKSSTKRRNSATTAPKKKKRQQTSMTAEEIKKNYSPKRLQRILEKLIEDARDNHEDERQRVERQLPKEIKSMFGQIGMGKFTKGVRYLRPCSLMPGFVVSDRGPFLFCSVVFSCPLGFTFRHQ